MTSPIELPTRTPICGGVSIAFAGLYGEPKNPIPDGTILGRIDVLVSEPCCGFDSSGLGTTELFAEFVKLLVEFAA
jgi:hypothetical protein